SDGYLHATGGGRGAHDGGILEFRRNGELDRTVSTRRTGGEGEHSDVGTRTTGGSSRSCEFTEIDQGIRFKAACSMRDTTGRCGTIRPQLQLTGCYRFAVGFNPGKPDLQVTGSRGGTRKLNQGIGAQLDATGSGSVTGRRGLDGRDRYGVVWLSLPPVTGGVTIDVVRFVLCRKPDVVERRGYGVGRAAIAAGCEDVERD